MLPVFGQRYKSADYNNRVQKALAKPIKHELILQRAGPGGQNVQYFDTSSIIQIANQIFGFNGWSHEIVRMLKNHQACINGRYVISYTALIRVSLPDGTYHEDIGAGTCLRPSLADAITHAQKSAVSDGLKRCLRHFGAGLGCEIDKNAKIKDEEIFVHKDDTGFLNGENCVANTHIVRKEFEGPGEGNFVLNEETEQKPVVVQQNIYQQAQIQHSPKLQAAQEVIPKQEQPDSPQRTVIKIRRRRHSQVLDEEK